ncbi:MAG: serine O-acetyltransferase [bacterium P3]|nr:MAG: serine O-acetyltransferase [bacterium P3]KWW42399.1 MAG: serine O-acetyltransferase [bacterium F083]
MSYSDTLHDTIVALSEETPQEAAMSLRKHTELPNVTQLHQMMEHVKGAFFPHFFSRDISVDTCSIHSILRKQAACGIAFTRNVDPCSVQAEADAKTLQFIRQLPEIKQILLTDVEAVTQNDPAASDFTEAVLCYPAVKVMTYYRTAHALHTLGIPVLPRIITEMAHSETGIDIHPAARIGSHFAIDHGTGVVIGETTVVGNHVMLYQGVTLGARNFTYDHEGLPLNTPRHPVIEDHVTIYSNTSVLGRIRIGHDSIIGGNVWLTHDVPPHSRVLQSKADQNRSAGNGNAD